RLGPAAGQTLKAAVVAVDFEDPAAAGPLVKPVHVLGDDTREAPPPLQISERAVGGVRFPPEDRPAERPGESPGLLRRVKEAGQRRVFGRIEDAPQSAGTSEVGDAALDRDPGPREGDDVSRPRYRLSGAADSVTVVAHRVRSVRIGGLHTSKRS